MAERWIGEETSFHCPFTGRAIKVCKVGPGWVAVSEGVGGGWVTSIQGDRHKLLLKLRDTLLPEAKIGEPARTPVLTCPMLHSAFRIAETSGVGWVASVDDGQGFGYSTSPFWSRRHLEFFLSTRAGVPPLFSQSEIEIRERMPPPSRVSSDVEEAKSRREAVHAAVEEVVGKAAMEAGVVQPRVRVGHGAAGR